MASNKGISIKGLKQRNQALVLKLIVEHPGISRVELAQKTHLTKTAVSNIVSDLLRADLVAEAEASSEAAPSTAGRVPRPLHLSPSSPKVIGVLIRRDCLQAVLGDLSGNILRSVTWPISEDTTTTILLNRLYMLIEQLRQGLFFPLLAVGISCIGPLDIRRGMILDPPNFYGIREVPIVDILKERTGLPVFLVNDGNAGALCEKMYGAGQGIENFLYVYLHHGIGSGVVLHGELYHGNRGQSGELGHVTINFAGPVCPCGNIGCLELYANLSALRSHVSRQISLCPRPVVVNPHALFLSNLVDLASQQEPAALSALDEYCGYLSHGILNVLNLLDLYHIILDYESNVEEDIIGTLLRSNLQSRISLQRAASLHISKSYFNGKAPLIGSLALVADAAFHGKLLLF